MLIVAYFNELSPNLLMLCFLTGLLMIVILHRVDFYSVVDVLGVYGASIFSVEVSTASVSACV